jgi:hypothetical protein
MSISFDLCDIGFPLNRHALNSVGALARSLNLGTSDLFSQAASARPDEAFAGLNIQRSFKRKAPPALPAGRKM